MKDPPRDHRTPVQWERISNSATGRVSIYLAAELKCFSISAIARSAST